MFKFIKSIIHIQIERNLRKLKLIIISLYSIFTQNLYDLRELKRAKIIIVFLIPSEVFVGGGIMAIFDFAKHSRTVVKDSFVAICTMPGRVTHSKNSFFPNDERIYRFEQIIKNVNISGRLILHVPEIICERFYKKLSFEAKEFLMKVNDLQINIMNQNNQLMSSPDKLISLTNLTKNVTLTTGFNKYTTQEICDNNGFPLYLLLPDWEGDYSNFYKSFSDKHDIIYYSPDPHERKQEILEYLQSMLPSFTFVEIKNMKYLDFLRLAGKSKFSITFGEGFDAYWCRILCVGGIGFAVYNEEFFSSDNYLSLINVFSSWDDLKENIHSVITDLLNDEEKYKDSVKLVYNEIAKEYSTKITLKCLEDFYDKKPTFMPNNANNS